MRCKCGGVYKVLDTREYKDKVARRRECTSCGNKIYTTESESDNKTMRYAYKFRNEELYGK